MQALREGSIAQRSSLSSAANASIRSDTREIPYFEVAGGGCVSSGLVEKRLSPLLEPL